MADVDITMATVESASDSMQSAVTAVSTSSLPPDLTGAKIAIVETTIGGGSPVSVEIG